MIRWIVLGGAFLFLNGCSFAKQDYAEATSQHWILVDDFEGASEQPTWTHIDAQNETDPFEPNPQVTERRKELGRDNHYLIRKPAKEGVVGNRKAISFQALPNVIPVGETFTLYTRINVESFPNNHSFGLSNVVPSDIEKKGYDAFEPMIRITDKAESDGSKNDGTLMVLSGYKTYAKISNPLTRETAKPLEPGQWYELWAVINNAPKDQGGQRYDLYVRGGEFTSQQLAYTGAVFRMNREAPLKAFMAISNTGPKDKPYGNGGVRYDDIYLAPRAVLTSPSASSLDR